jgi:AI-2E family transporter
VLFLFFLLVSGDIFLHRLVEILPRFSSKRQVVEISQHIESDISAYLVTITIMNAAVGIAMALAMWLTGVGDPILWGTVAFLLNYVPILGTALGALIFLLAGLLTIDPLWQALLPAALYLGLHLIEGETVTPMLLARRFTPQSRPRHHLARLLVLDVGDSGRNPLRADAGDRQDHLRPYSAAGRIWPLSRGVKIQPPSQTRVH